MRQVVGVQFHDDGKIGIDWVDSDEMSPKGGDYHSTFATLRGQEEVELVDYYAKELRQDADEFLHHVLKMLNA